MPVVEATNNLPDPNSGASPNPSAQADGAAPGGPSPQIGTKPDGLPDAFWDPQTGFKQNEFIQSYAELAEFKAQHAKTFENFPEKPEDAGKFYTLPEQMLPEGVTLPEGVQFQPDEELLAAALPVAHKHKLTPEAFHDLVRGYNAFELARYQAAQKDFAEDGKKLGARAAERRKAVADGLKGLVGDKAGFIDTGAISSQAVEFFEAVLDRVTRQSNVVPLNTKRDNEPPPEKAPLFDRLNPKSKDFIKAG